MALRNQPYIPLYVQDFLTDEKLLECSSSSIGIYIMIMCVMHKSKDYGTILLKQKDKQKDKQSLNFAYKLVKHLPFTLDEISIAIDELVNEDVLQLIGDKLSQKRMISDNELSMKRSEAGKKGGKKTQFDKSNNQANIKAISENEDVNENENEIINKSEIKKELIEYFDYLKKDHNRNIGHMQIEQTLKMLDSWYKNNEDKKKCLSVNIANGWKTINFVKDNEMQSNQPKSKIYKDLSYAGNEEKQ